jgi:hypothetical protein
MHKFKHISLVLIAAAALGACDEAGDTSSRSLDVDLQRFGIDQVLAGDGEYELLDAEGVRIGTARGRVEATDVTLQIELADQAAALSWSPQDLDAACIDDGGTLASDDGVDACASAVTVAARIAEAEGSTPPFADDDEFRLAPGGCTTVSTWVGGSSCSSCRQEAELALPGTIVGGTCSSGWIYTTCQYTSC